MLAVAGGLHDPSPEWPVQLPAPHFGETVMSLVLHAKSDTISISETKVGSIFVNALRRFARWRAEGRAARELSRYPDALLKDMGVTRGEIPEAVRNGRSRVFDLDVGNNVR
jgi:uncharacterized protein YjiS (DUF1127 family)